MSGNIITDMEAAIVAAVQADIAAIKQFWNTEEPIIVGELMSAEQQLASIVVKAMVSVLGAVASGTVTSGEAFGKLVTSSYQTAISTGLSVAITDVQAAAAQAYSSAKAAVTPPAQ